MSGYWIEPDLRSQKTLNRIKKNVNSNSYICWLFQVIY